MKEQRGRRHGEAAGMRSGFIMDDRHQEGGSRCPSKAAMGTACLWLLRMAVNRHSGGQAENLWQ